MAAEYDRFIYRYTNDLGFDRVKVQRAYYVMEGGNKRYTSPITPLFEARVILIPAKLTGTSKLTRRLIAFIDENNRVIQRTAHLPYMPLDNLLPLHIKEIFATENIICGDYQGEAPLEKNLL